MKKIAVILSGCGFQDGSEVHESTLTLLSLVKEGLLYRCMAPNTSQTKVFDYYLSQYDNNVSRNVLSEAGKIARSDILNIADCDANDYDGAIFPGGAGAATTLSNFATNFKNYELQQGILNFAKNLVQQKKPIGFICIAPCLIPGLYGEGVQCTIGNNVETLKKLEKLGCKHIECGANEIVVDENNKVVTTPAYMLAKDINQVFEGIGKLVKKIKEWC